MYTKQLSNNLGCHCGVRQLSGGVLYPFSPFNPSLNFLKFHLNSFTAVNRINKDRKNIKQTAVINILKYAFYELDVSYATQHTFSKV